MDKKEIILNTIIEEYLKRNTPIGSNELKRVLDLDISASTIRVYFKKLSHEGILEQLHTSSGRVPTWNALKMYWRERYQDMDDIEIDSIEDLKECVREFNIYCLLRYVNDSKLSEIINVNDRFLLIVFEDSSVVLEYNEKIERFLSNLIGYKIDRVRNISINVGLYELRRKIEQLLDNEIVLKERRDVLYEMSKYYEYDQNDIEDFMHSSIFEKVDEGVYFEELVPRGYMALRCETKVEEKDAKLFCIGKVDSGYKEFLYEISTRRQNG